MRRASWASTSPSVELPGVLDGLGDGALGDLVEHHPLDRHLGAEDLLEVPGDGLALAVLVRGEVELVGLLQELLQALDLVLLVGGDDVERLEVVLGVDAQAGPLLLLVGLGHVGGVAGQVADVTDGRLDGEVVAEEARDGAGLGGGLDDDEGIGHGGKLKRRPPRNRNHRAEVDAQVSDT